MNGVWQNLVWQDFLLASCIVVASALAYIDLRHIKHMGYRRLSVLLIAAGVLSALSWAGYRYYDARKSIDDLSSQVAVANENLDRAERRQEVERHMRDLRQSISDLNDAYREFLGGTPTYHVRLPVDDNSESASVSDARSHIAELQTALAALPSPWEAARDAILIVSGVMIVLLAAYWPAKWSLAGFRGPQSGGFHTFDADPDEYDKENQGNGVQESYEDIITYGRKKRIVGIFVVGLLFFVVLSLNYDFLKGKITGVSALGNEDRLAFSVTVKADLSAAQGHGGCAILGSDGELIPPKDLMSRSYKTLEGAVNAVGGPEAIRADPSLLPIARVHGDDDVPWHCVAGAMTAVGKSGYPKVEMSLDDGGSSNVMFTYEPPMPIPVPSPPFPVTVHTVSLKSGGVVLWDAEVVSRNALRGKISERNRVVPKPEIHFDAQSNVNYGDVARLLSDLSKMGGVLKYPDFKIATEEYSF